MEGSNKPTEAPQSEKKSGMPTRRGGKLIMHFASPQKTPPRDRHSESASAAADRPLQRVSVQKCEQSEGLGANCGGALCYCCDDDGKAVFFIPVISIANFAPRHRPREHFQRRLFAQVDRARSSGSLRAQKSIIGWTERDLDRNRFIIVELGDTFLSTNRFFFPSLTHL